MLKKNFSVSVNKTGSIVAMSGWVVATRMYYDPVTNFKIITKNESLKLTNAEAFQSKHRTNENREIF